MKMLHIALISSVILSNVYQVVICGKQLTAHLMEVKLQYSPPPSPNGYLHSKITTFVAVAIVLFGYQYEFNLCFVNMIYIYDYNVISYICDYSCQLV